MPVYAFNGTRPDLDASVFIAPNAQIMGNVHIARGSSVWFGSVLRGDMDAIRIGEQTNIQDLCVCHTDTDTPLTIGNRVTIGHSCIVHGCTIEDESLIGMGAIVMNHAVIGKGAVIAAGAVVLEKTIIAPYSLVTGSPGKVKKTFDKNSDIAEQIRSASLIYAEKSRAYGDDKNFYAIDD